MDIQNINYKSYFDFIKFGDFKDINYTKKLSLIKKNGNSGEKCIKDSDCFYNMKCLKNNINNDIKNNIKEIKNNNEQVCRDWGMPVYNIKKEKINPIFVEQSKDEQTLQKFYDYNIIKI